MGSPMDSTGSRESELLSTADSPDTTTSSSDLNESSPRSNNSDEPPPGRAMRVLRIILEEEFDVRLGISEPPEDMIDAVSECLDRISLSLQHQRSLGFLVPLNSFPLSADTSGTTTLTSAGTNNGKTTTGARKRGASDTGEDGEDDLQDEDLDDDEGGACVGSNVKKAKIEQYPCPLRKRNPLRFNIRDWEYCAKTPFKSMPVLKKHIKNYHCQTHFTYKCVRCHGTFPKPEDLAAHLRQDSDKMCQACDREGSPSSLGDDTFSAQVGERLRNRAEHFDWSSLWKALFPRDKPKDIPSPDFEPAVELHEVFYEYKTGLTELQDRLATGLDAVLPKLPMHNLERPPSDIPRSLHIFSIFDQFMEDVFQKSRAQAGISSAHPRPRRPLIRSPSEIPTSSVARGPSSSRAPSATTSPRPSSTLSASTNSGSRSIFPRLTDQPTPGQSSRTSSPTTPLRNFSTPILGHSPLIRSHSRRDFVMESAFNQSRPPPDQFSSPPSMASFPPNPPSVNHPDLSSVFNTPHSLAAEQTTAQFRRQGFRTPHSHPHAHPQLQSNQGTNGPGTSGFGSPAFSSGDNNIEFLSAGMLPWSPPSLSYSAPCQPVIPDSLANPNGYGYLRNMEAMRDVEHAGNQDNEQSLDAMIMSGSDAATSWMASGGEGYTGMSGGNSNGFGNLGHGGSST
ncbi:hypothetical protein B0T25DRAFT_545468 [Lasiosphaeria hispida]|uniref:C2H2-type domain-containing protein n=1 Tax=Lasiosphaeria hispida TaxID=260671 RepID=A0AAJ0MET1_9PEZI|nr:hypothetical protein B0T25DRAFT_545468 [Lasiosphaeria hispida]